MTIIRHTFRHAYDDHVQTIVPLTALMLKPRDRDAISKHGAAQISDYSEAGGRR
jgi:hypothetical protein